MHKRKVLLGEARVLSILLERLDGECKTGSETCPGKIISEFPKVRESAVWAFYANAFEKTSWFCNYCGNLFLFIPRSIGASPLACPCIEAKRSPLILPPGVVILRAEERLEEIFSELEETVMVHDLAQYSYFLDLKTKTLKEEDYDS